MKRTILSAALAASMVLTTVPGSAMAAVLEDASAGAEINLSGASEQRQNGAPVQEQIFDLSAGSITLAVGPDGTQTVTQGSGEPVTAPLPVITGQGSDQNTLTILTSEGQTAKLTLRDLIIDVRVDETTGQAMGGFVTAIELGSGRAEITVEDSVQLQTTGCPAIHVSSGSLLLKGTGTLALETEAGIDDQKREFSPAVIGSDGAEAGEDMSGTIEITDGLKLSAVSVLGSKIDETEGPGPDDEWGFPTGGFVNSGYVPSGPCIGAGAGGAMSGTIRVMGHAQLDLSSDLDACIGGGIETNAMSGSIVIGGDAVVLGGATVGAVLGTNGADIAESGSITIQDRAQVTAYGSAMDMGISVPGAGIGTGYQIGFGGHMNGTITIQDEAIVDSESGTGAAIGAGDCGSVGGSIVIRDRAQVTRAVSYEEKGGAGIGAGYAGSVTGSIIIQDQAQVSAESCQGAGIGTGYGEIGDSVELSGHIVIGDSAVVRASNTDNGAAIGTGYCGNLTGSIAIKGQARVDTWNEARGAGIGSGEFGKISGSISIMDTVRLITCRAYGDTVGIGPGLTGSILPEYQLTIGADTHIDGMVEFGSESTQRNIQVRGITEMKSGVLHGNVALEICPDAVLTLERGASLDLMGGELTNNGTVNNGGTIILDRNAEHDADRIRALRLSGEGGLVAIRGEDENKTFYDNHAAGLISRHAVLNFTGTALSGLRIENADPDAVLERDGYKWEGNTLTISRLHAEGLILPSGMEVVLEGVNVLTSPQFGFVALDVQGENGENTELMIRSQSGQKGFLDTTHMPSGSNATTSLSNAKNLTLAGSAEITADCLEQDLPDSTVCFKDQSIIRLGKKLETNGAVMVQDRADIQVAVLPDHQWHNYALKAASLELSGGHFFAQSQDSAAVLLLAEENPLALGDAVTLTQPANGITLNTTVNGQMVTSIVPEGYKKLFLDDKILEGEQKGSTNAARMVEFSSPVEGKYTVSFEANGGTGNMEAQTVPGGNYILPDCGFTAPEGKRFKAWAIGSPEGEQENARFTYDLNGDIVLYAIWENLPLSFTHKLAFDIPSGDVSTAIQPVDVKDGAVGGQTPYTFEKISGPDWLDVSADGIITGTRPASAAEADSAVIGLTDSTVPVPNQKRITISVGEVLADAAAAHGTLSAGMQGILPAQEMQDVFGRSYEPQSYIWMGSYEGQPILWRVLDDQYDNMGQTGAVFMLSEYGLGTNYLGGVYFDHTDVLSDQWAGSDAQLWCDEFEQNSLTALELSSVRSATKQDWPMQDFGWTQWKASELKDDQVFFLSAGELADYVANHDEWDLVYAQRSDGGSCSDYYLRSPMQISGDRLAVGVVNHLGKVNFKELSANNNASAAARPALNLKRNQVLFTSAAVGGKADTGGKLKKVMPYDGNEWKLTVLDSARSGFQAELSDDGTQILYSGAQTGENEYISVLVMTNSGEITHYGRIAPVAASSGTADLDLSGVRLDGKTLYVINEQYNGGKHDDTRLTDYSSSPICLQGKTEHSITVNSTAGGTARANLTAAVEGTTVQLDAQANTGYHFVRWQITPAQLEIVDQSFRMPAVDVEVQAIFERDSMPPTPDSGSGGAGGAGGGSTRPEGKPDRETVVDPETGTITEIEKKKDGTVIRTETAPNGDKIVTVTQKDGSSVKTEEKSNGDSITIKTDKNGAVTEEWKRTDGTGSTIRTSAKGQTQAEVTISEKAIEAGKKHNQPIVLPMPPLEAGKEQLPEINVKLPEGSSDVRIEIPVTQLNAGTVPVIVCPDGREEPIRDAVMHAGGLILTLDSDAVIVLKDKTRHFSDVPDSHWAVEYITFVTARHIFNGTGVDSFSPDTGMSRGMLAVMLHNLAGNPKASSAQFSDVPDSAWYSEAVGWAAEQKIVNGVSENTFAPDAMITREQLAVMLWRYVGSPKAQSRVQSFDDWAQISEYARTAMDWAVEAGVINGMDGHLNPQGAASRAQVAAMVTRFLSR